MTPGVIWKGFLEEAEFEMGAEEQTELREEGNTLGRDTSGWLQRER